MNRGGFSLAEVIVAMTLLSIGTLGVAATGLVAAHAFTRAEMRERTLHHAESILDSLAALRASSSGTRTLYGAEVSWSAADSISPIVLRITWRDREPIELVAER